MKSNKGTTQEQAFFNEIDHAEIRALKNLETIQSGLSFGKISLYTTVEPCLMYFSAIILTGIKQVAYAFEDPMGDEIRCDAKKLPILYEQSNIQVVPGALRQKSLDLFYNFFNKETNLYWKDSCLEGYTLE